MRRKSSSTCIPAKERISRNKCDGLQSLKSSSVNNFLTLMSSDSPNSCDKQYISSVYGVLDSGRHIKSAIGSATHCQEQLKYLIDFVNSLVISELLDIDLIDCASTCIFQILIFLRHSGEILMDIRLTSMIGGFS